MTPETLFEQLKSVSQPPSEALFAEIEAQKEALTPLLLEEVRAFAEDLKVIEKQGEDYIRHVIAPFLLANFRHQPAYPALIKLISHSGDKLVTLTGEVFTEALGRILASVYDGNLKPIQTVIENPNIDIWIRSAALESLVVLWKEDQLSRSEVINYLKELMTGKLERVPSYIWDNIGLMAYDMHPNGMEVLLQQAINDRLIAPLVLDLKLLDDCIKSDLNSVIQHKDKVIKGYIQSPVEELSWWLYPNENPMDKGMDYADLDVPMAEKKVIPGERFAPMGWRPKTVTRTTTKIGRNDPCYCGSGKKYKKCCAT